MRKRLAVLLALAALVPMSLGAVAQNAPAKDKAAPKSSVVLLCPQQKGGDKVNVRCGAGEKCCYHPLFDNGSCVPQGDSCMGIVNPLPPISR